MSTAVNLSSTSVTGGSASVDDAIVNNNNNKISFATVVKSTVNTVQTFPKREQAIVFDSVVDASKNDYIISTGELIGPKNIIFASRISNNRVCIYFSSKEIIDEFMIKYGGITLKEKFITARRLVSQAKRVILSNVSPCIPHETIECHLKTLNIKTVSPISFINAGLNKPEYKHILSFRRQVYITLEENQPLPDSTLIKFNNSFFRIFISTDEIKCFLCKTAGHIASNCPSNDTDKAVLLTASSITAESDKTIDHQTHNTDTSFIVNNKRPAPSSADNDESSNPDLELSHESPEKSQVNSHKFIKPLIKRKKEDEDPIVRDATALEKTFSQSKLNMEEETFKEFLNETKGRREISSVIEKFSINVEDMLTHLITYVKNVESNNLRSRIKRLIKKIRKEFKVSNDNFKLSDDELEPSSQGYTSDSSSNTTA